MAILAEEKEQYCKGGKGTQLHGPEYARAAVHPEKVKEIHVCKAAQQYACGIAHKGGSTLKVRGDGYGYYNGNGGDFKLF